MARERHSSRAMRVGAGEPTASYAVTFSRGAPISQPAFSGDAYEDAAEDFRDRRGVVDPAR